MADELTDLGEQLVLADLVNRVLDRGVSVMGEVTISVAGVDLIHLGLRLDLSAIETMSSPGTPTARVGSIARALERSGG